MNFKTAHQKEAYLLSKSQQAEEIINSVELQEIETAETEFSELLKQIPDADLRERIDLAAGRISFAYETLGFIAGFIMERTLKYKG